MSEKEGREREGWKGEREKRREAGKETAESTTEKDGERKSKGEKRHPFSRGSIDASASFVDFRAENADALAAARGREGWRRRGWWRTQGMARVIKADGN